MNEKSWKAVRSIRSQLARKPAWALISWFLSIGVIFLLLVFVADLLVRLFIYKAQLGTLSKNLGIFITSPGAGGLAAVTAAVIGAIMILIQFRHTKSKDRDSAWWEKFEWVTERALPSEDTHKAIPSDLAINILNSLQSSAETAIQQQSCGGFTDHLVELETRNLKEAEILLTKDSSLLPSNQDVPNAAELPSDQKLPNRQEDRRAKESRSGYEAREQANRSWNALQLYVDATRDTPAQSVQAEAALYEYQVLTALKGVEDVTVVDFSARPGHYSNNQVWSELGPDGEIDFKGHRVLVEIENCSHGVTREGARKRTGKLEERINRSHGSNLWLIISNGPVGKGIRNSEKNFVEAVEWTDDMEADVISNALEKLVSQKMGDL